MEDLPPPLSQESIFINPLFRHRVFKSIPTKKIKKKPLEPEIFERMLDRLSQPRKLKKPDLDFKGFECQMHAASTFKTDYDSQARGYAARRKNAKRLKQEQKVGQSSENCVNFRNQ